MRLSASRVVFSCEACGAQLHKRTSALSHKFLRLDSYICGNPVCSAAYTGHTELTGIASPSGMPEASPSGLPETPAYQRAIALEAYRKKMADAQAELFGAADAATESKGSA